MEIITTPIRDVLLITPRVFNDSRGYFFESFRQDLMEAQGINSVFVQDNQAFSTYGTLRGLHFQSGQYAQSKLVRVTQGEVLDVIVDLRRDSATYGQSFSIRLSEENNLQMYVPRGFAHGYVVLSPSALFQYKCDNYYHKLAEGGIRFDDPDLDIDWIVPKERLLISEKDQILPLLRELKQNHS